jgi:hypothetical protein
MNHCLNAFSGLDEAQDSEHMELEGYSRQPQAWHIDVWLARLITFPQAANYFHCFFLGKLFHPQPPYHTGCRLPRSTVCVALARERYDGRYNANNDP